MGFNANDHAQLTRYSRHLLLSEWSIDAQQTLSHAKVLVIGVGGLGCPAAQMLASTGVGHLTLVDDDTVNASNVMRQQLHTTERVGMNKALSAQIALHTINPACVVDAITQRLDDARLLAAVQAHDVVLDCSDNATTRYALNYACVHAKKPLVSGAAIRFDGQLMVFDSNQLDSPCYHCVFPKSDAPAEGDRCAVTGVFAPLTQQIGTLQAAQAILYLSKISTLVIGQLQLFSALDSSVQSIHVARNPQCTVCVQQPQKTLIQPI